jgi:MFS family permease
MAEIRPISGSTTPASFVLGHELDSIPFRGYHVLIIAVLGRVGFIEGYDLVITGSPLVLAKAPLQLTDADNRWLIFGPPLTLTVSGFAFSAVGDRLSRKTIMLFGVTATTFSPC